MKLNMETYEMETKNIKVNGKFINRELSLINFNERVLYYASNDKVPLNERLNFLSITGSNTDEFISVRFADAYHNKCDEPYKEILKELKRFKNLQSNTFNKSLKPKLEKEGIHFVKMNNLSKKEKENLYKEYEENIFPLLTPINISTVNSVPCIPSGQVCIVVTIMHNNIENLIIIPIESIDLLYQIGNKVLLTEDIIMEFMKDNLFVNKEIISKGVFRVIRDASIILSHDQSKFIVDRMSDTINKRKHSKVLFIETTSNTDKRLEKMLINIFKVPNNHIYNKSNIIDYKRFGVKLLDDKYSYNDFTPFDYENHKNYYNLFDAIKNEDILLHHPYDSYNTVIKFIEHAARDKDVIAIKQTLYRVSSIDSPIINALCCAARNGKKVTVLIEIKARFDEDNNIKLISKLENSGATVILGLEYLKTHCKMCIIVRKENKKLKLYSHVSTGNYNEKTAKMYTDLSYFTSKQKIGNDLLLIFNILSGYSNPDERLSKIFYAPVNLRKRLIKCIDNEIDNVKKGKKGEIFIKINSLSDRIMANKLYEAADKGVNIYIICRGVCSVVPRKNIFIKSIVGRFLEHSRIYYFRNNGKPEYYISSADLLTRNLDKRIETLISLNDTNVTKELQWIINVFKEDKKNSFIMNDKGIWIHDNGDFNCHEYFIKYTDVKKDKKNWK